MRYAELHAKSNFSFLTGASHPEELVARAAELGYAAVAVTDVASLAGVVRAHAAAKEAGIKLVVGAEIAPVDAPPLVLWATDRASYGRLARLITLGRRRAEKGECHLTLDDVAAQTDGLIAGVLAKAESGERKAEESGQPCRIPPLSAFRSPLCYRDIFGDRCYLLAELHRGPDDERTLDRLLALARKARVPLVAAGDVHYHAPERAALHDVLSAVRCGCTVAEAAGRLFPNAGRCLKPREEIAACFGKAPELVHRTVEVADRCTFSLDELRYEYPEELAPAGQTPMEHLGRLAWRGAGKRYPEGLPEKVRRLLEHELQLIGELHYEAYFLTVWDLVRFARKRGILCQGRGSAANSAVCYCLGVTSVDPERMDLLFERFVSRERDEAPDIDVDFEHERREEVLQYLYEKYGRERAGMTAEVICYRPRSAVRDVGKVLGLSLDRVDALAKKLEHYRDVPDLPARCREAGIDSERGLGRQLVELVAELVGFPRHLSQHTGGMVMTRGPLCELVPIENAAMADRTVIQWNKDDLDELGILKVDCLALGMLTAIHRCFDLIDDHYSEKGGEKGTGTFCAKHPSGHSGKRCQSPFRAPKLTLAGIPADDPEVYAMIRRADTMGVFQIESRAQMSMLPRLRPRCFYDLVIEVAIVRPGPIQGDMVHPYLRRRNGEETVRYPNEAIRQVLEKTLGVPLFQEQAMRLAVVAAGFTPGEADQLRRAMGAWRRPGVIDEFRRKLITGMRSQGLSEKYAEAVFTQIRGFGDYGFPESHAASFALLVYVSAWLKCRYPAAFTCGLLNSQPMGFYAPAQLIRDVRNHGVEVRPVDVNASRWDCTLEGDQESGKRKAESGCLAADGTSPVALRLGFRMLQGMSRGAVEAIEIARQRGSFGSVEDFARRTGLGRAVLARLARSDAFASLEVDQRQALWHALGQDRKELPLFARGAAEEVQEPDAELPKMSAAEEVLADYRTAGFSLKAHPLKFLREGLSRQGVDPAVRLKTLPHGGPVQVAGIVLVRQRPATAKGITFVTLEDETGQANLIIRPDVWAKFRSVALGATLLLAQGRLQRQGLVIHVLVGRLENLSARLAELGPQSRDFC